MMFPYRVLLCVVACIQHVTQSRQTNKTPVLRFIKLALDENSIILKTSSDYVFLYVVITSTISDNQIVS